jgi:hypothetical protein
MLAGKNVLTLLFVLTVVSSASVARASVLINEIFADPPAGLLGDANNDGVRSGTQDEFIELMNFGSGEADISAWSLLDSVSTRHVFPPDTVLAPNTFLVVFGGGSPNVPGVYWQVASSGSLGLNNGGDTVTLSNAEDQVIDQVLYGEIGDNDQSIARYPDGIGSEFVLHAEIGQSKGALFSPGAGLNPEIVMEIPEESGPDNNSVVPELPIKIEPADDVLFSPGVGLNPEIVKDISEENDPDSNPVVPELPTLIYIAMGWGGLILRSRAYFSKSAKLDKTEVYPKMCCESVG